MSRPEEVNFDKLIGALGRMDWAAGHEPQLHSSQIWPSPINVSEDEGDDDSGYPSEIIERLDRIEQMLRLVFGDAVLINGRFVDLKIFQEKMERQRKGGEE